ncbi:MAG: DUF3987 domain-containing protein [Actinobacteria bacterium]|nr:DUF3987 domain-containing protein [Actinomycetota bacterium]
MRVIEPHTEADPVALLAYLLAGFGNLTGRGPHFVAEADRHHTNLFFVLVGETAKGRKDSARGQVLRLLETVDPTWKDRVVHGLSSGEGLIHTVRDGNGDDDLGVGDKRLFVIESEFASPLKVMRREGNTLSVVIRNAWDRGDLRVLTRRDPLKATDAHVSVVGHVTRDEVLRHLTETEAGNGFGNRFIWLCVRRSKCLPEGGNLSQVDFAPLLRRLKDAVDFARDTAEVRRDDEARQVWAEVYPELSEGKPGLLGAMIARSEAQVMRLATLYALLDCSPVIRRIHLHAALSLWDYAEASARYVFGDRFGDPVADDILAALGGAYPEGMTRTGISAFLSRNISSERIRRALAGLMAVGLITYERVETDGRPAELFRYAGIRNKRKKRNKGGMTGLNSFNSFIS